jgi:hypothetical protein
MAVLWVCVMEMWMKVAKPQEEIEKVVWVVVQTKGARLRKPSTEKIISRLAANFNRQLQHDDTVSHTTKVHSPKWRPYYPHLAKGKGQTPQTKPEHNRTSKRYPVMRAVCDYSSSMKLRACQLDKDQSWFQLQMQIQRI